MDRRGMAPRPRAFDLGDPRTPMAWQHRNFNFQQEHQQLQQAQQYYGDRYMGEMLHHPSDSCDEPTLDEMYHHHQYIQQQHLHQQQQQQQQAHAAAVAAAAGYPVAVISQQQHATLSRQLAHTLGGRGGAGGGGGVSGGAGGGAVAGVGIGAGSPLGGEPRSRSHSVGRSSHPPQQAASHRALSTSSNSSATSDSTGLDSDSQLRAEAALPPADLRQLPMRAPTLGTLRSVQSTLSTWDGEPCPVHHVQVPMGLLLPPTPAQMFSVMAVPIPAPMPAALPPPPPPPVVPPPPPPVLLPPMLRPRPLVLAADAASRPEPLPVRDPKMSVSPLPPKECIGPVHTMHCCKGNIIVLWVVLGIIFVGILLAVILRFVTA